MADWEEKNKKELQLFQPIKLLFENHAIKRMFDIRDIHSGKIAGALGINKGRYAQKLANPETFLVFEILRFAFIIGVDPNLVINVIQKEKEVISKVEERVAKDTSKGR